MSPIVHRDARGAGTSGLDFHLGIDVRNLLRYVALANREIGDAHLIPGLQVNRAPDAAGDEGRAPVPSILVGRLA